MAEPEREPRSVGCLLTVLAATSSLVTFAPRGAREVPRATAPCGRNVIWSGSEAQGRRQGKLPGGSAICVVTLSPRSAIIGN